MGKIKIVTVTFGQRKKCKPYDIMSYFRKKGNMCYTM